MTLFTLLAIVFFYVVPVYICHEQGKAKNRYGLGWGLGLGWVGVLALAALPAAAPGSGRQWRRSP